MRIIGGSARGHPLKTPNGDDIRPTTDKVRLAMFNALYSRSAVVDAIVIDAFCGTGALGLEALSQGAQHCYFFDVARSSLALAKQNALDLQLSDRSVFTLKDVAKIGDRPADALPANLVFLDPPYRKDLLIPTITRLRDGHWLREGAWIVIESEKDLALDALDIVPEFDKTYGEIRVRFIRI